VTLGWESERQARALGGRPESGRRASVSPTFWRVLGHDSVRAAIIYQHAGAEADARIAAALEAELSGDHEDQADDEAGPDEDEDGGAEALVPAG
jgi:hypothetical protein